MPAVHAVLLTPLKYWPAASALEEHDATLHVDA
jgi:hypothetical protein